MNNTRQCKLIVTATLIAFWSYSMLTVGWSRGPVPILSPVVPRDVVGARPTQADYDNFAWQTFVALNWPTRDGRVDPGKIIGQAPNAPRVWELYTDPIKFFKVSGVDSQVLNLSVPADHKLLYLSRKRIEKLSGSMDEQAASYWPLIDQNKNFALFEIRVNDTEKNYIISNNLNSPTGVKNYKKPIVFPFGSIEIKAAWRLFPDSTPKEILARYHTRKAVISVAQNESSTGEAFQIKGTVGLVGLHIINKTRSQPKWIWATFEHVDNYEIYYKPLAGLKPTFSSGGSVPSNANWQPTPAPAPQQPYLWSATQPTASKYNPTEAARCPNEIALPSSTNMSWQEKLARVAGVENSPWQYYRLNTVQWFDANDRLLPKNQYGVAISRNSVLETYLLGDQTIASQVPAIGPVNNAPNVKPPNSTLDDTIVATIVAGKSPDTMGTYTWSSCVLCHQMALYQYGTSGATDFVMTDYSFLFRSYLPKGGAQ